MAGLYYVAIWWPQGFGLLCLFSIVCVHVATAYGKAGDGQVREGDCATASLLYVSTLGSSRVPGIPF